LSNKSSHKIETAKRYAKALLLSCNNSSDVQKAKKDFDDFIKTFNKLEELKFFFQTPLINPIKKKKILIEILNKIKLCEIFSNFLITLANNGKLFLLKNIFIEFNNLLDEKNGVLEVSITTIDSIEKTTQKRIQSSLEKTLNCKIKLKEIIDTSIIGGIILKVNSIMIDNSIKNKLQDYNFNERLN
tara:strand:+ start:801 stop:1358 length:558 start_codon:yes stop_codon:yes gene_type:complete